MGSGVDRNREGEAWSSGGNLQIDMQPDGYFPPFFCRYFKNPRCLQKKEDSQSSDLLLRIPLSRHATEYYRWVPLKPDFLGAWKSVRLKHYPAYPFTIISLIMQKNLAKKIRAKRESGLTAVRLKRDPPVLHSTPPIMKKICGDFLLNRRLFVMGDVFIGEWEIFGAGFLSL